MESLEKIININEECVLCGKCADTCPFDAIKIKYDGDIMFRPNSCVSECEVCALSCPVEAITYSYLSSCGGCSGNCSSCSSACKENK